MRTRLSIFLHLFPILIIGVAGSAWGQVDATKVLIGTWEGAVALGGSGASHARTIVIKSVKPKDNGGWVAEGNYGITGERLARMTYQVSLQDGEIVLDFVVTAPMNNPAHLKLVGDRKLEGWLNVVVGPAQKRNRPFMLEKVEPKTEEAK